MIHKIEKHIVFWIFLVLLFYTARINWGHGQWERVIRSDGKGYYAYLPAVFIYHDLNFGFFQEAEVTKSYDRSLFYDYRSNHGGRVINKYFIGESLLVAPFFLIAHLGASITGLPADGYSRIYIVFLTIAALFYLSLGLYCFKKTLRLYGFSSGIIVFTLVALLFGTNLFYYSIGEVAMSHVYSFSMVSVFIYQVRRYFNTLNPVNFIFASIALGLIILIRPVNGLVILSVPFLSGTSHTFRTGFGNLLKGRPCVFLAILCCFTIIAIQLMVYKLQTGDFLVYSYGSEGFDFQHPHVVDFLFSFKKGFFIYTPLCLIALFGLIPAYPDKFEFYGILLFLLLVVYFLSCWWMWYYGGSFSARVMVEYLPYFGILLAGLVKWSNHKKGVYLVAGLMTLAIMVNQVQTIQYRYFMIHWSEMDKQKYWDTFLDVKPIVEKKLN
ncbi:MAG: hypothetical protein WCO44_08820 [Bacteroidota bacterium]